MASAITSKVSTNHKPAAEKPAPSASMSKEQILALVAAGTLTVDDAAKLIADPKPAARNLFCKVAQSGGCSLYGLQRMPVTLYVEQWERLLDFADSLRAFLVEHDAELKRKQR
jgi:hypothetical protein